MKYFSIIVGVLILMNMAEADWRYNPMTDDWEGATDEAELKYNPHNEDWQYVEPDEQLKYNPHNEEFEWTRSNRDE